MHRRQFIAAASAMALTRAAVSDAGDMGRDPAAATSPVALDKLGVRGMVAAMQAGRLSSAELTAHYLERIEALNRRGPKLAAVIETNPRALEIAHALDRARVRGALHGVPVLIKDNIETSDPMMTTAGSLARGLVRSRGCSTHRAPARRGCGDPGQEQPQRVGRLSLHPRIERLERPGWPGA